MVSEFGVRTSDHVVTVVGSFLHEFIEFGSVLREPLAALGNSPKATLRPLQRYNPVQQHGQPLHLVYAQRASWRYTSAARRLGNQVGVAMRKVVFEQYGPPEVLDVIECQEPQPKSDEVRVRIHATTVTTAEAKMRRGEPRWMRAPIGFTKPRAQYRTLGTELAGVVDAVGRAVTRFREGDEVFGFTGWHIGANADYLCLPEDASLVPKPTETPFGEAAAAVDGATTALHFLRARAKLRADQRVLIIGASGSIGTYAVQLAKRLGAEVTGVCGTANVELVRSLGADHVIDYRHQNVRDAGKRWDVVFDTVGVSSFAESKSVLAERGVFMPAVISIRSLFQGVWTPVTGTKRLVGGMSMHKREPLRYVAELLADQAIRVVIDTTFPMERIRDAHRLVDTGHKRGNVVINVV